MHPVCRHGLDSGGQLSGRGLNTITMILVLRVKVSRPEERTRRQRSHPGREAWQSCIRAARVYARAQTKRATFSLECVLRKHTILGMCREHPSPSGAPRSCII